MDQQKCQFLLDSLSDYVDGNLGEQVCAEIEKHLVECEDCRIVVDSLRKTISLYHTASEHPSVPADVKERLFRRLQIEDLLDKPKSES
jgi:predicted anti-sigma-YlaC factor YlaD